MAITDTGSQRRENGVESHLTVASLHPARLQPGASAILRSKVSPEPESCQEDGPQHSGYLQSQMERDPMNPAFSPNSYKLRITIRLKDGRVVGGTYPYLAAMARIQAAEKMPDIVKSWDVEAA